MAGEILYCDACGSNLALVGRAHHCVPRPQKEGPRPPKKGPVSPPHETGDGVALTSMARPPGLIEKLAGAIRSGKLLLPAAHPNCPRCKALKERNRGAVLRYRSKKNPT
jgi:hypothetical protein